MLGSDVFQVGEDYETISYIGGSDLGIVYKAKNLKTNEIVAIKVLNKSLSTNSKFLEKLKGEIAKASQLDHDHLANLIDNFHFKDKYYVVRQYAEGNPLDKVLEKFGRLDSEKATNVLKQLSAALYHAHSKGLLHGDIKPENIIISDNGNVMLTDFGLSKASAKAWITTTGTFSTNAEYMSPEQAEGDEANHKSEIYTLGIIAYQIITGKVPFKKQGSAVSSLIKLAKQHISETPAAISLIVADIPEWLEKIVFKCLEKKVGDRFQSSKELLVSLEQEQIVSLPPEEIKMAKAPVQEIQPSPALNAPPASPPPPPPQVTAPIQQQVKPVTRPLSQPVDAPQINYQHQQQMPQNTGSDLNIKLQMALAFLSGIVLVLIILILFLIFKM